MDAINPRVVQLRNVAARLDLAIRTEDRNLSFDSGDDAKVAQTILETALGRTGSFGELLSGAIEAKLNLAGHVGAIKQAVLNPPAPPAAPAPKAVAPVAPMVAAPAKAAPRRAWTLLETFSLADKIFGQGFSRDINLTSHNDEEKRRRIVMAMTFAGLQVPGLIDKPEPAVGGIAAALKASRQSAVDEFLSQPTLSDEEVVALGAYVFGEASLSSLAATSPAAGNWTERSQAKRSPAALRQAIVQRLKNCGVRVEGIPELDGCGPVGTSRAHQKRVDEFLASRRK